MSKETNEREILSAYFDSELSPEDRQRAEQLLEESTSTRREIDEIAELSELIKSLPSETAPAELLPAVLRQAERETLLAADTPTSTAQRNSRSWLTVISGIAVTAAAVVLVVQMLPRSTSHVPESIVRDHPSEGTVARNDEVPAEALRVAEAQSAPADMGDRTPRGAQGLAGGGDAPVADDDLPGEPLASATTPARGFKRSFADRPVAAAKTPSAAPAQEPTAATPPAGAARPLQSRASDALSMNAEALKNARRGDVLQYFSPAGTKVTTYMVTVVDVKQAVDKMQVLLARNEIPARMVDDGENDRSERKLADNQKPGAENKNQSSDKNAPTASDADEQQDRLIAVYVETTPDRFTSAFKELMRDKLLADLYPKPPVDELQIEVAKLGQSRRQLFGSSGSALRRDRSATVEEETTGKKRTSPAKTKGDIKDRPTESPQVLLSKVKQLDKAKRAADDARSARKKAETGKDGKPFDAKEHEKAGNGLVAGRNRADAERETTPSFQLRVELAPVPKTNESQKSFEQRANLANRPGFVAPQSAQNNGPLRQQTKQPVPDSAGAAPVRVLFVFRQVAPKSRPQP